MALPVYIIGSGTYLPGEPIPFEKSGSVLGELVDAPKQIRKWIQTTTPVMNELLNIKYLHYAIDPETGKFIDDNISMSVKAANAALQMAGITSQAVDLICYGSAHMQQMPTTSVRIQEALGIESCQEFSIHANCTSSYKALYLAFELLKSGQNRTALVLSSSMSSSELRADYYNQKLVDKESLFLRWFLCDGAGAILLTNDETLVKKIYTLEMVYTESVGGNRPSLMFNNRPAYCISPLVEFETALHHLRQNFRNELSTSVFQEKDGSVFFNGLKRMLSKHPIPLDSIRFFQVNMPTRHIIDSIMDECVNLGIKRDSLFTNLDQLGYCGPPMSLIGLDSIIRNEKIGDGERIVSFVTEVSKFMQAGYSVQYADSK